MKTIQLLTLVTLLANAGVMVGAAQKVKTKPEESSEISVKIEPSDYFKNHLCNLCGKYGQDKCSVCWGAHYCSYECQKKDWKKHKLSCSKEVPKIGELTQAVKDGNLSLVKALIFRGADVNEDNESPILWAAEHLEAHENNFQKILEYLVEKGADVNTSNPITPLFFAADRGNLAIVTLVVEHGANVNDKACCEYVPLMKACEFGHLDVVHYLLSKNADVNAQTKHGATPLMSAAREGHLEVVKLLIQNGALINKCNHQGDPALIFSIKGGHLPIIQYLIENPNTDVNLYQITMFNISSFIPLFICAVEYGHLEVLKYLLTKLTYNPQDIANLRRVAEQYKHQDIVDYLQNKCSFCEKEGKLQCTKCKVARYCSKECQKQDWKNHKTECTGNKKTNNLTQTNSTSTPLDPNAQNLSDEQLFELGTKNEVEGNNSVAVHYYERAAKKGNVMAMHSLGFCYERGCGIPQNFIKAVEWYTTAARKGFGPSECHLGLCYKNELGVKKDLAKARHYFELSAKKNLPQALCNLGFLYSEGEGVTQDKKKAFDYYQQAVKASNQAYPPALCNLGLCYFEGAGTQKNLEQASQYFTIAAKYQDPKAHFLLGRCYLIGDDTLKQDLEFAYHHLFQAVNSGYSDAKLLLDKLQEVRNSFTSSKKSAHVTNLSAQQLLEKGLNCEKNNNDEQALNYYVKAAELGDSEAQYKAGLLFKKSNNPEKAAKYFLSASNQLHTGAFIEFQRIMGSNEQEILMQAQELNRKKIEQMTKLMKNLGKKN